VNFDQEIPMAYHLWVELVSHDGRQVQLWLPIHQWWGRRDDFLRISEQFPPLQVTLDFREDSQS
jgi:hypothetical protein